MTETILLVEDEPGLAQSLQKEFQFEGYQVILAGDGEKAVAEFEKFQAEISLVILDWMLPKLDGLGVLRRDPPDQRGSGDHADGPGLCRRQGVWLKERG